MTYSCMRMHTTIGAAAFHFRVRNGIGWCHSAIVTRERVEGRGSIGLVDGLIALTLSRGGCSEQFASFEGCDEDECLRRVVEDKAT